MRGRWTAGLAIGALALVAGGRAAVAEEAPEPRLSTYSIVAHDPDTGELGVAVQSHWLQVGTMVPWARAGVGAVATQALTNPAFGPDGLDLLAAGNSPKEALAKLLARDAKPENRQVALVDAQGRVAAHTGARCLPRAGHRQGQGFSVQANLMGNARVWPAMARAFERADGPLAERLLAALTAAQQQGGDLRGAQSAALLVVGPRATGQPWRDRRIDLRVADHPHPLDELGRLLRLRRAYDAFSAGEAALAAGRAKQAAAHYAKAARLAPRRPELTFWRAVSLCKAGQMARAVALLRRVLRTKGAWGVLLERLPAGGVLTQAQVTALKRALAPPKTSSPSEQP